MPKSIGEQLNETLHNASFSYMRNTLRTERDLAELDTINQRAEEKQEELKRLYIKDYGTRFDAARSRLLDNAAQFNLNHPPPPGGGVDRASIINQEAHRQVESAHESDLARAREEAQQAFEDLVDRVHRRNQVHGMARDAFGRASDRRSGGDRRTQRYSQD